MNIVNRVINAYINSSEDYFNQKAIIQDRVYIPSGNDDLRDSSGITYRSFTNNDFNNLIGCALNLLDKELFLINTETALYAALDTAIYNSDFQSKIDAVTYDILFKHLKKRLV